MSHSWKMTRLECADETLDLLSDLARKRWLSRGQAEPFNCLLPSIDREDRRNLPRREKLKLERRAIEVFRSTARYFTHPGEEGALTNDIVGLMVLRHYGVPTRLLDWSARPYVAAYFAACDHDDADGEIWSFDEPEYERAGKEQWKRWPETTSDRSGNEERFNAALTAFTVEQPPNWFICAFYTGFPRQDAQRGVYSMTARFGRDHAEAIAELLSDDSRYHRYVISAELKPILRKILREEYGVWRGALFPDAAGAAQTAGTVFKRSGV